VTRDYPVRLAEPTIGYSVAGASQLPPVIENQKMFKGFKGTMTRDYLVRLPNQLLDIQWLEPANFLQ
jgi:hypothetical protein